MKIQMRLIEKKGLLASFTVVLNDSIYLNDFKLVDGKNGIFVSYPNRQGTDGKYYNIVYIGNEAVRNKILQVAKAEYNRLKNEARQIRFRFANIEKRRRNAVFFSKREEIKWRRR